MLRNRCALAPRVVEVCFLYDWNLTSQSSHRLAESKFDFYFAVFQLLRVVSGRSVDTQATRRVIVYDLLFNNIFFFLWRGGLDSRAWINVGHRNRGLNMLHDKSFGLEAEFLCTARRIGGYIISREKGLVTKMRRRARLAVLMELPVNLNKSRKLLKQSSRVNVLVGISKIILICRVHRCFVPTILLAYDFIS